MKNKLAFAIASLIASSAVMAKDYTPDNAPAPAPSTVVENTLGGVSGITSAVYSENMGTIDVNGSIGSTGASADIAGGIGNSVGISAVGSSASVSTSTIVSNPNANVVNNVTVGSVDSSNSGFINNYSQVTGGAIEGGINNSVSISAVGSSASLSSKTIESGSVSGNSGDLNNAVGGGLGVGVDVSSVNTGDVVNDGIIAGGEESLTGITNSVASSIGINGVGSSASASTTTIADGAISSPVINTMDVSSLTSSNLGNVSTVAVVDGGSIAGGIGNSVSAAAIGSSASMTNSVIMQ